MHEKLDLLILHSAVKNSVMCQSLCQGIIKRAKETSLGIWRKENTTMCYKSRYNLLDNNYLLFNITFTSVLSKTFVIKLLKKIGIGIIENKLRMYMFC